jgi:transposase
MRIDVSHADETRTDSTAGLGSHRAIDTAMGAVRARLDDRTAFNGILLVMFTGIACKGLPGELGPGNGMIWLTTFARVATWSGPTHLRTQGLS